MDNTFYSINKDLTLCNCGSLVSKFCKAVVPQSDAGTWSLQGRQSGEKMFINWKAARTSWYPQHKLDPTMCQSLLPLTLMTVVSWRSLALHHRAKHTCPKQQMQALELPQAKEPTDQQQCMSDTNGCRFISTLRTSQENLSCFHPDWKHTGKGILTHCKWTHHGCVINYAKT